MDVKYVDTLLLDNEEGCTWRQIPIKFIHLNILEESFCMFHEHIKNYLAHLNSSVSLKPCLIEQFCTHGWIQRKKYCYVHLLKFVGQKKVNLCWPVLSIQDYLVSGLYSSFRMLKEKHNAVENEGFYSKLNSTQTHQIWLPVVNNLIPATYATSRQICFWPALTSTR